MQGGISGANPQTAFIKAVADGLLPLNPLHYKIAL